MRNICRRLMYLNTGSQVGGTVWESYKNFVRVHNLPKNDNLDSNSMSMQKLFYSLEVQNAGVDNLQRWRNSEISWQAEFKAH